MPRAPRDKIRIRREIATLYAQGLPLGEIALRVGSTTREAKKILDEAKKDWRISGGEALREMFYAQLAKIDAVERAYWDAWKKSCAGMTVKITKTAQRQVVVRARGSAPGIETLQDSQEETRKETSPGNPAFLKGVQDCIDQRAKLLGLFSPEKHDLTVVIGTQKEIDFTKATDAELYLLGTFFFNHIPENLKTGGIIDVQALPEKTPSR